MLPALLGQRQRAAGRPVAPVSELPCFQRKTKLIIACFQRGGAAGYFDLKIAAALLKLNQFATLDADIHLRRKEIRQRASVIEDRRDQQAVPERFAAFLIVQQVKFDGLSISDSLAHSGDIIWICFRPLQEPAVMTDYFLTFVPGEP